MAFVRNLLSGNRKYIFGLLLLSSVFVICAAFSTDDGDEYDAARREVLLRRIGHELLLQSGDSTSRVMPVKKITENEYQISFEKELSFTPDSLLNTTRRFLDKAPLSGGYVVNVLNCGSPDVAYGYAISKNKKEDIVSCKGRIQPKACYVIVIQFQPEGIATAKNGYLLGGLSFLACAGFMFLRTPKTRQPLPGVPQPDTIPLGAWLFDAKNRKLCKDGSETDLTATEARLLLILAASPNQTITRSRLQKEIWEDEGVIVGRSLDMFISKLRKKLESDPGISIVVVRGKGYRLEA